NQQSDPISPGALHGLAGEISTLVNVFSQQGSKFSTTALVTVIVIGALERVKRAHHRTFGTEDLWVGPRGAGMVERAKKMRKELEPEPGMT
ncbi:hypothetical protein FRC10_005754, partial [Ceratobasidium sp. 414]